jgi:HlyD family secretion protein
VTKGETIALLAGYPAALAALHEAEVQVAVAESSVNQAKAPDKPAAIAAQQSAIARQQTIVQNAESVYERKKLLFDSHLIAAIDFETSELDLKTARESLRRESELLAGLTQVRNADVEVAEAKLAAAVAARDAARAAADQQTIVAPLSATVLQIYSLPGEAPGADGIVDLGDTSHMFVEAEVYATDIRRVHAGAAAEVTGEAFEGVLTGKVTEILREAGFNALFPTDAATASDKRVIRVRIGLDDPAKVQGLSNGQVAVRIRL